MQLKDKFQKAEKLAKKLGASEVYISGYNSMFVKFGQTFYGPVEVRADVKYGSKYSVEISGSSFRCSNKREAMAHIKNMQNAIKVYEVLK